MSTLEGDSETMQGSSEVASVESSPVPMLRKRVSSRGSWAWPLPSVGVEGPECGIVMGADVGWSEGAGRWDMFSCTVLKPSRLGTSSGVLEPLAAAFDVERFPKASFRKSVLVYAISSIVLGTMRL